MPNTIRKLQKRSMTATTVGQGKRLATIFFTLPVLLTSGMMVKKPFHLVAETGWSVMLKDTLLCTGVVSSDESVAFLRFFGDSVVESFRYAVVTFSVNAVMLV